MSPLSKGRDPLDGQNGSPTSMSVSNKQSPDSRKRSGDARHSSNNKALKSSRETSPSSSLQQQQRQTTSPGRSPQSRKASSPATTSPSSPTSSSTAPSSSRKSASPKSGVPLRRSSLPDGASTASNEHLSSNTTRSKVQSPNRSPSSKAMLRNAAKDNEDEKMQGGLSIESAKDVNEEGVTSAPLDLVEGEESISISSSNSSFGAVNDLHIANDRFADAVEEDNLSGDLSLSNNQQPQSLSATVSRGAFHQCGTARRVKVYELKGETWFDRGTGYCAGVYDEQHDAALLVARMEEGCRKLKIVPGEVIEENEGIDDRSISLEEEEVGVEGKEDRKHFMLVVRDTLGEEELLLKTRVVKEDVYQRQQDTLVVWTEPDGTDMALSFQEADGCHEVWEFLTEVQKHFILNARQSGEGLGLDELEGDGMISGGLGVSNTGMASDGELIMSDGSIFNLPIPDLDSLQLIDISLKEAASRSPQAREKIAEWILRQDYLLKLLPVFHDAEDLEQLQELHRLCNIMHTILMLNDGVLVERILHDDVFLGAVGMLEYDPEFPRLKASYRDYLTNTAKFRLVIDIYDESVLRKIHQTFRLQYLKDVILARILDDSTFAVLNSLIFYHQADIVTFCTSSEIFLASLFQIFDNSKTHSEEKKAEAIIFLQQLCAMGKQVQLPARIALYRTLTEWGLLLVLEFALGRKETRLRNAAAEMLMTISEYDAMGVRVHVLEQVEKGITPLITKCCDILHESQGDLGLKTQITESLRILFDSGPDGSSGGPNVAQTLAAAAAAAAASAGDAGRSQKDDVDRFLNWFYDGEVDHLFSPLKNLPTYKELHVEAEQSKKATIINITSPAKSALFSHLCELLTFIMIHHHFRSQYWVISSDISIKVTTLLFAREKHLRLTALRFFRACLAKGNQFINRHFLKIELVSAVLAVVENELLRDNLVTSACLEFFEHIRKENMRPLLSYLMERHESRIQALTHHKITGHYFSALILQWEKNKEVMNSSWNEGESSSAASFQRAEKDRQMRDIARRGDNRAIMDSNEEIYFNEEDEEYEGESKLSLSTTSLGEDYSSSTVSAGLGLVSYTADEDDDEFKHDKGVQAFNPSQQHTHESSIEDVITPLELKRKKGSNEEEEEEDLMGRIAKRKTTNQIEPIGKKEFAPGGFIREEANTASSAPSTILSVEKEKKQPTTKRFSINLSSNSEKMLQDDAK